MLEIRKELQLKLGLKYEITLLKSNLIGSGVDYYGSSKKTLLLMDVHLSAQLNDNGECSLLQKILR